MAILFTSDLHFGHSKVIGYSGRPFADVNVMNEALVENWNLKVNPTDLVYCLGDFSFCKPELFFPRLNGQKYLIRGNHDWKRESQHKKLDWVWIKDVHNLKTAYGDIWLSHFPHVSWNKSHWGSWHLHGHSHGKTPGTPQRLDVGVDCWGFKPVSLEQIAATLVKPGGDPYESR